MAGQGAGAPDPVLTVVPCLGQGRRFERPTLHRPIRRRASRDLPGVVKLRERGFPWMPREV